MSSEIFQDMDIKGVQSCWSLFIVFCCLVVTSSYADQDDIGKALQDMETSLKGVKGDTQMALEALQGLKNDMKKKPDHLGKVVKIAGSVTAALGKLTSKDAKTIVAGCLDIVSGIATTFGGPVGIAVGAVASFISAILGLFTGGGAEKSVGAIIDSALKKHRDERLEAQAAGAKRDFAESSAFIKILKKHEDITKADLTILAANVPIYKFSQMLGTLENRILRGAASTDLGQARKTVDFVLLYCQLVIMRETMLLDLSILYRKPGTANHIADAVDNANKVNKQFAKDTLDFLHNLLPEHALVGAVYHPLENSQTSQAILKYVKYFGISPPAAPIRAGYHLFKNIYWKSYSICSESYMGNHMFRGCYRRMFGNIKVERLSSGHYTMQNRYKRKLYVTKHDQGWAWGTAAKDPGPQGHLIFIPLKSGNYMMSTKKWPHWFLYMESSAHGYIRSWKGNPGPQGLWDIV